MPEQLAGRLSIATLNTWGIHILGSRLAGRYTVIGTEFEAGRADVVCFQEVLTYWHLWLLARLKGALVTRLAHPGLCVVNTHPVANKDGDWSRASRFYPLHRVQLAARTRIVGSIRGPAVVCGDFNVDRDSACTAAGTCWAALGDLYGKVKIPIYAAPTRATDLRGLPAAYICVGNVDGFRDEAIDYATRLNQAGVPAELHVYAGAPHGVKRFAGVPVARRYIEGINEWIGAQLQARPRPAREETGPDAQRIDAT